MLVVLLVGAACSSGSSSLGNEDTSNDICSELDELDAALDAIDGDSVEEFRRTFDAAQEEYAEFREVAIKDYPDEVDAFDDAMDEFERELLDSDGEGIISGVLDLVSAAADLAAAGDRLDDVIDCPG